MRIQGADQDRTFVIRNNGVSLGNHSTSKEEGACKPMKLTSYSTTKSVLTTGDTKGEVGGSVADYWPVTFSLLNNYSSIIVTGVETFNRVLGSVYISGYARSYIDTRSVDFTVYVLGMHE